MRSTHSTSGDSRLLTTTNAADSFARVPAPSWTLRTACLLAWTIGGCAAAGSDRKPCGLVQRVQDPFDGEIERFGVTLDPGGYLAVGMKEVRGARTLIVLTVQRGVGEQVGRVGDPGEFIVGGETLTLPLAKESPPIANARGGAGVFTQWLLEYTLSPEQAARFAAGDMTAARVEVAGQKFQMALDDRQRTRFRNSAKCMQ